MRKTASLLLVVAVVVTVGVLFGNGQTSDAAPGGGQAEVQVYPADSNQLGESQARPLPRPIPFPIPPTTCGGNVCGPGQYCCNASCGTCVAFGNYCTQEVCNPTE